MSTLQKMAAVIKHAMSPKSVLGIVFRPDGKTLLLLRRNTPRLWSPAGGYIDPGEGPEQAVLRELWEETSIRGKVVGKIDLGLGPKFRGFVIAAGASAAVKISEEHSAFYWFSMDQLPPRQGLSPQISVFLKARELYNKSMGVRNEVD